MKGIREFRIGENSMFIEESAHFYLAVVFEGLLGKRLPRHARKVMGLVEDKYGMIVDNWYGDMDAFAGVDEVIGGLVST